MDFSHFLQTVWVRVDTAQFCLLMLPGIFTMAGAAYTFLTHGYHDEPISWRGFLRFCLPARILKARQTRLDIGYALLKKVLRGFWGWGLVGHIACALVVYNALTRLVPAHPFPALAAMGHAHAGIARLAFIAVAIFVTDFLTFFPHYLEHKIQLMWQFHQVHHSALTLTLVTNRRFHPVQELWDEGWISVGIGALIAVYSVVFAEPLADMTIAGIDGYLLTSFFSFHHLRHSHIYMRYPYWLERILLSPAQHQIHHSREERHHDRNFGLLLSCWDRLFDTIVYSEPTPATNLGLFHDQENYETLPSLFVMPFVDIARKLLPSMGRHPDLAH